MSNPGLLHLRISCCNQRFRSSAFGTKRDFSECLLLSPLSESEANHICSR